MLYNLRLQVLKGEAKKPKLRIRGIALPNEHGSWGILLEPLVSSLAVAPSAGGVLAALFVIGAFLLRQPSKILVADLTQGRRLPQTRAAAAFVAGFGMLAAAGALGALITVQPSSLIPLIALVPFGAYQLYNDVSRRSRNLIPELAGSAAISASAPAIALAGGWQVPEALALWGLFIARSVPSIVYIRQRLRLEKGKQFTRRAPFFLHLAGLAAAAGLAYFGLVSVLPIPLFVFLLYRSAAGLSDSRRRMKAVQLGIRETVYGAVLVLTVTAGYYLGF